MGQNIPRFISKTPRAHESKEPITYLKSSRLTLSVRGDCLAPSGYSSALRDHIRAMVEAGLSPGTEITAVNNPHDKNKIILSPDWKNLWNILSVPRESEMIMHYETPDFFKFESSKTIGYTYWETDRIINFDLEGQSRYNWVKQMNRCTEVWTACCYAADAFKDSGVKVPIRIFPWPINSKFLEDVEPAKISPAIDENTFVILGMGQWTYRKNLGDLISACMAEFKAKENVCLVLKSYIDSTSVVSRSKLIDIVKETKANVRNLDPINVILVQDILKIEDLIRFMSAASLMVSTSRGEGHGGPVQQAMALGVPTVATGYSAFADYQDGFYDVIRHIKEPVRNMSWIPWYGYGQNWCQPDLSHLRRIMRNAYQHFKSDRKGYFEKGQVGRNVIRERYTASVIGPAMVKALQEIKEKRV